MLASQRISHFPSGQQQRRQARALRATCEALEPRVVLTITSVISPTVGSFGVVLGATSATDTNLSGATAVAVQTDGKTVEVGTVGQASATAYPGLAVRRYNLNGTLDTTFGTNGQVNIPAPYYQDQFGLVPQNVVIEPDGSIVFAAVAQTPQTRATPQAIHASEVVRLTPDGRLDPTFGSDGSGVAQFSLGHLTDVAVRADGSIYAAGYLDDSDTGGSYNGPELVVVRLTPNGNFDTTFGFQGFASIPYIDNADATTGNSVPTVAGIAVDEDGRVLVGGADTYTHYTSNTDFTPTDVTNVSVLARFTSTGALDTTFGTGGRVSLTPGQSGAVTALGLQPSDGIILAGTRTTANASGAAATQVTLVRLQSDGRIDTTFGQFGIVTSATTGTDRADALAIGFTGFITVAGTATIGDVSSPFLSRYSQNGVPVTSFGINGRALFNVNPTYVSGSTTTIARASVGGVAIYAETAIEVVGTVATIDRTTGANLGNQAFLAQAYPYRTTGVPGDYDGDGKADIAGVLGAFGIYAYRPSSGLPDVLAPFGPSTVGAAIPAPGDYDGDGETDIAAYFPAYGSLVYRPSSGGGDVAVPFGIPGAGQTIPAPGDYDGDGKTDVAAYFPSLGEFVYRPSAGGQDVTVPFGIAGAGQSLPAPGDYDFDGKTDPAVYLENLGEFAYRPSSGRPDVLTQFGIAGQSIPAPGDYDGDGGTDLAVYIPALGIYAYRPSSGEADVLTQFGIPGAGNSIPVPGDYDGDGKTDLAVYLPSIGTFAERPSSGGADVLSQFGAAGIGLTVPAASLPVAFVLTSSDTLSASSVGGPEAVHDLALTDDLTSAELALIRRKHKSTL